MFPHVVHQLMLTSDANPHGMFIASLSPQFASHIHNLEVVFLNAALTDTKDLRYDI